MVPKQSSESLLELDRARVQFGTLVAVHDVSLRVEPGDLLGLIGPNGAGKTTLLRTIAGIQPLTSGRVRVMGEWVLPGAIAALRHIGFTPDNPPVYEELTVRNFLRFVSRGYLLNQEEMEERIDFWLEQVWLKEKADQKIKALSRGMRQRIGIARTLISNPQVILLDEPAAGLDPAGRVQFRRLLCDLREQGKVIIVSSHILADMNEYCTHIGIMAHGTILQLGTVAEVACGGNGERCRYTMKLARPTPELRHALTDVQGLESLEIDREYVTFEFSSHPEEAARLLRHMVTKDIPVAAFSARAPGLEEAYLRTGIRQVE